MKTGWSTALLALLAGCATSSAATGPVRLGQTAYVDGPRVTPLKLLEDSRCPADVQCVWAGQVRLRVRVHLGSGDSEHELVSGLPLRIADGTLELAGVAPLGRMNAPVPTGDYRFTFRFMGGL